MKGVKREDMIIVEKRVDERRRKVSINPLFHSLARHFVLFVYLSIGSFKLQNGVFFIKQKSNRGKLFYYFSNHFFFKYTKI